MKAGETRELRNTEDGQVAEQQGREKRLLPVKHSQPKSSGKAGETREHGEKAVEGSSKVVEDSCLHYFECQLAEPGKGEAATAELLGRAGAELGGETGKVSGSLHYQ